MPSYASPCYNSRRYSSACSCVLGPTDDGTPWGTTTTTTTVPFASQTSAPKVSKDARVKLDVTANLDVLCQSEVAEAVEDVEGGSVVTKTEVKTSLSMSTVTVVSTTTKVTLSGLAACTATATGRGLVANAVVVATSTKAGAASATASLPAGCLKDTEASAIVDAFKAMLSSQDKNEVKKTAEALLADEFMGMSTSVNSLKVDDVSLSTILPCPQQSLLNSTNLRQS